jgi:phosphatidylserine decarboxylase
MAREGIPYILFFGLLAVAGAAAAAITGLGWLWALTIVFAVFALFMAYFFRDPDRTSPGESTVVVSPADGRVMVVEKVDPASPNAPTQVSIFLSPMDVHINRSPIAGTVVDVVYKPGAFKIATKKIASEVNEQNVITIENKEMRIVARQIAGLLARRVVCWKRPGDAVSAGERIGLMKFSSRMDVVMPAEVEVLCRVGDIVVGGETIIGRKRS